MCKSISIQSIRRANQRIMSGRGRSFSSSGGNAEIRCHTTYGSNVLSIPVEKIRSAAETVLKQ